tara:strand:+ start:261 stop:434 length:174 start_codon:yes stop_codon:yes gene_type:complete
MDIKDSEKRKMICEECEHLKHVQAGMFKKMLPVCKKCGCLMRFKWPFPAAKCPIDKW